MFIKMAAVKDGGHFSPMYLVHILDEIHLLSLWSDFGPETELARLCRGGGAGG